MMSNQPKSLTPLLILRILEEYSDKEHPITREEIERILNDDYGITLERKAFFRHMKFLGARDEDAVPAEDCVADICRVVTKSKDPDKKHCAGFYLADRTFNESELRIIIDALSGSHYLSQWETEDLVQRLANLGSRYFRKKMSSYQFIGRGGKTQNETLMLNLEIIDEAISEHKQIRFALLRTESDGRKVLSDWQNESCSPVRFFVKEHNYYLVGVIPFDGKQNVVSYKLSDMVNVEKLNVPAADIRSLPEFKNGIDWQKFLREHPALDNLRGKPELCTFLCYRWMLDEIKCHFGDELRIRQLSQEENKTVVSTLVGAAKNWLVEVSVITDPYAAMQFAWYHPEGLWLISPERATKALRRRLETQQQRYADLSKIYG